MEINVNNYIITDPEICHGKPTFKGTRIMVSTILQLLGAGMSIDEIRKDYYPQLSRESILSVFDYASKLLEHEKNTLSQ